MSKKLGMAAIATLLLLGSGCGRVQDPLEDLELNSLKVLIKQSSERYTGTRTISIRLLPPTEGAYQQGKVQFAVLSAHRWVAEDIHRYELALQVKDASGAFVDPGEPAVIRIDPRVEKSAVFANLKQGETYRIALLAKGNIGGTASGTVLNTLAPTQAVFTFAGSGSEVKHQGANMQAALDPTIVDPQAALTIGQPEEGEFHNVSNTVEVY